MNTDVTILKNHSHSTRQFPLTRLLEFTGLRKNNLNAMQEKFNKWVWIGVALVFGLACQKTTPPSKHIEAKTKINPVGWIPSKVTTVNLMRHNGEPISGARVTVENDTLDEVEPGKYIYSEWDVFTMPDTFILQVNDNYDVLTVQVPTPVPQEVEIISPASGDTFPAGQDVRVIWRKNALFSYYKVNVKEAENDNLIFQTILKDSVVVIPGDVLPESGEVTIDIWVVSGPQLENGNIVNNISAYGWEGIYEVKILGFTWLYLEPR